MKIRYFLGIAILYIALVTGYIFYAVSGEYTLTNEHLVVFSLTLPIALWFCLPLVGLLVIALLYMGLMLLVVAYKKLFFNRDIDKIVAQIREGALGEVPKERVFAMQEFKQISAMLKRFYLVPNLKSEITQNSKIDSLFTDFKDIANGIESKRIRLSSKNPLYLQNIKNSMRNDVQKSLEILKSDIQIEPHGHEFYGSLCSQNIYNLAWDNILASKNAKLLKKALQLSNTRLSVPIVKKICLLRIQGENNLDSTEIIHICKSVVFSEREYLELVIELCKFVNSNNISFWLNIFERLSKETEKSVFAYFYLLLEVGKTKEALDLKEQYPKDDYLSVSAFIALKDKGYPLLVFFEPLLYRANKYDKLPDSANKVITPHIDYELSSQ